MRTSATDALLGLVPPFQPSEDAFVPTVPTEAKDPTQDPALRPEALSPALLAAPLR